VQKLDPTRKLRGVEEFGKVVSTQLKSLGPGAIVLCDNYQTTAEMAFYVEGQPKTYCAGSYFQRNPKRFTQYDMWPDRALDQPALEGRDAVYVGEHPDVRRSFQWVEGPNQFVVRQSGQEVRDYTYWRCHGFKLMRRPQIRPGDGREF
jgi:hypothetical protein